MGSILEKTKGKDLSFRTTRMNNQLPAEHKCIIMHMTKCHKVKLEGENNLWYPYTVVARNPNCSGSWDGHRSVACHSLGIGYEGRLIRCVREPGTPKL